MQDWRNEIFKPSPRKFTHKWLGASCRCSEYDQAELKKKKKLRAIKLDLGHVGEVDVGKKGALEGLQPHADLEIKYYIGSKFPLWMSMNALLSNLVVLKLYDCKQCKQLPGLGKLESLEELVIDHFESVTHIGIELYQSCDERQCAYRGLSSGLWGLYLTQDKGSSTLHFSIFPRTLMSSLTGRSSISNGDVVEQGTYCASALRIDLRCIIPYTTVSLIRYSALSYFYGPALL
ncbi:hypothetical protein IFM89_028557 [Coptis chinensis]|uniref:R13L1/DRL21-like LRR repeat region domain-containing protein n=1 Tax=Coptis chinensis TaxID=261450 RepID=A0A835M9Y0_9MAGN|nr:hypothetical protein IFM89_028557 [Coptis chinensis]